MPSENENERPDEAAVSSAASPDANEYDGGFDFADDYDAQEYAEDGSDVEAPAPEAEDAEDAPAEEPPAPRYTPPVPPQNYFERERAAVVGRYTELGYDEATANAFYETQAAMATARANMLAQTMDAARYAASPIVARHPELAPYEQLAQSAIRESAQQDPSILQNEEAQKMAYIRAATMIGAQRGNVIAEVARVANILEGQASERAAPPPRREMPPERKMANPSVPGGRALPTRGGARPAVSSGYRAIFGEDADLIK